MIQFKDMIIISAFMYLSMTGMALARGLVIADWSKPFLAMCVPALLIFAIICVITKPKEIPVGRVTYENSNFLAASSRYIAIFFALSAIIPTVVGIYFELLK